MFSSEWSAALSSLLPQYSYITTSVAQSALNKIHRHQQMSQPAEATERGFCLFVMCRSRETSLKSPPASNLDCFCYAPEGLQKALTTFANLFKQQTGFAGCVSSERDVLVGRQKKTTKKKRPRTWDLGSNAAKCWVPSVPTGCRAPRMAPARRSLTEQGSSPEDVTLRLGSAPSSHLAVSGLQTDHT